VIAGEFGGRRLEAPRGLATRPTSDRVREALFMTLEPLSGLAVVDLFAGSGALGIEALSRGAIRADFVEADTGARRVLEKNLAQLGLESRARVWPLRLPQGLRALKDVLGAADVVLADPPYGGDAARILLRALGAEGAFTWGADARLVIEHHAKDELPERAGGLARVRSRQYGETVVSTYRIDSQSRPEGEEER
jgi:16S rRNA (guanine(966)-N(2))-methyltransferase RsmD